MKDKIFILLKIVIGISLLAFLLINIQGQASKSTKEQEKTKQAQGSKLNIALVNEDLGTNYNNKDYNLGSNYIKKIEKDAHQEWYTVSRGIAESGLKNGNYNLMITIPSNFSTKILSLDELSPEKVNVTYKVNSNGNKDLENEANKVGNQVINQLNQQLVDIYIASILDNLYTSQKNIKSVIDNQNMKIGDYDSYVYQPTTSFKDNLQAVDRTAQSSKSASEGLENILKSYLSSYESFQQSQESYQTSLEKLVQERLNQQKDYAEFVEKLLAMDTDLLSSETSQLYEQIKGTSLTLQNEFTEGNAGNFDAQMSTLQTQFTSMDEKIIAQKEKVEKIKSEAKEFVDQELIKKFGLKSDSVPGSIEQNGTSDSKFWEMSVYDFLVSSDLELKTKLDQYIQEIEDGEKLIVQHTQNNMKSLPYFTEAELSAAHASFLNTADYHELLALIKNGEPYDYTNFTDQDLAKATEIITKADKLTQYFTKVYSTTIKIKLPESGNSTVSVSNAPASIQNLTGVVKSKGFSPGSSTDLYLNTLPTDYKLTYQYNPTILPAGSAPQLVKIMIYNHDTSKRTEVDVPIDFSIFASAEYKEDVAAYNRLMTSVIADYRIANSEIELLSGLNSPMTDKPLNLTDIAAGEGYFSARLHSVLNLNMYQYLQALSADILSNSFDEYSDFLDENGLESLSDQIKGDMPQLIESMRTIQMNTVDLQNNIQNQLQVLENWRKQSQGILTNEKSIAADQSLTDTQVDSLNEQMKSLLNQSGSIREGSQSNIEQSNNVTKIFDEFNQTSREIENKSNQLSRDATTLKSDFDKQQGDTNGFVSQFSRVLANAHQDGVPNNHLMTFLSNPVSNVSQGAIQSADTYKPFSWIMMLFVISLFAGYAFSTRQLQTTIRDVFGERKWIASNLGGTVMVTITALTFGGILGVLSGVSIGIPYDERVIWVLSVLLLVLSYTLLNSFLSRQFKMYGLGIGLLFLTIYIFLTDVVGTISSTTQLLNIVRAWNPLYQGERILSSFFTLDGMQNISILWLLGAISLVFLANLLVWHPDKKMKFQLKRKKEKQDDL